MRPIDANVLKKALHESLGGDNELLESYELLGIDDFINAQPTCNIGINKETIKNILWNQKYSDSECLYEIAKLVGIHKKW